MSMYWQHFLAWLRGDIATITKVFDKALADLEAHIKYTTTIADNQASAARSLAARSKALYEDADKARTIKANVGALVGK